VRSVLFVRHGESTFNAAWREKPVDPLHCDACLSETGIAQVRRAQNFVIGCPVESVITSPLTRALQTTAGLFSKHPMKPRILVEALLRERVENSCDIGRSPRLLAAEFPFFDLAQLEDVWWHVDGISDVRGICVEPVQCVQARVSEFRTLLQVRPERFIAVVGHGTFLSYLTGKTLANCEIAKLALPRR
jgi:glucosyl-3-phosphoglycerate phosphatase